MIIIGNRFIHVFVPCVKIHIEYTTVRGHSSVTVISVTGQIPWKKPLRNTWMAPNSAVQPNTTLWNDAARVQILLQLPFLGLGNL